MATLQVDPQGHVVQWGSAASRLFGLRPDLANGRDLRELLFAGDDGGRIADAIAKVAVGETWVDIWPVICADGSLHDLDVRLEPVVDGLTDPHALLCAVPLPPEEENVEHAEAGQWLALLNDAGTRIGATLDLANTAEELVAVAAPRFADAAGVFVLHSLVAYSEYADRPTDGPMEVQRLASRTSRSCRLGVPTATLTDDMLVHGPETVYSQCVAKGEPVRFDIADGPADPPAAARQPSRAGRSSLVVPMIARGRVSGYVVFTRDRSARRAFTEQDVALASGLVSRAALCVDNALLYERERRTAVALQESLLPDTLSPPPGLRVAHRYLPASDTNIVGGDWFDMIPLDDTRVALVVGDAMGHDTPAAAVMGQLRTAARTLAGLDLTPTEVLTRLDRIAEGLQHAQFATCLYAVCDAAARHLMVASAGHIPPVLALSDGTAEKLDLPPGLPLGLGMAEFETVELDFPVGTTLVMCTDGLVESRGREFDVGLAQLRSTLTGLTDSMNGGSTSALDKSCDTILQALRHEQDEDDITLLLARSVDV